MPPSIMQMARAGRNGDTQVAHMSPGEMVIPKEVVASRPDLVAHVADGIARMGADPSTYQVGGAARRNPTTGAMEFASTDDIQAAYQQQFGRAATDADVGYWSQGNNFADGFSQAAAAEKASTPASSPAAAPPPAPAPSYPSGVAPAAQGTYDSIYGNANSPVPPAQATSTAAPAPAPATSPAAAPGLDWTSIYHNVAGRDADPASIAYQNKTAADVGDTAAYQGFLDSLKAAGEVYNPNVSLADAQKAYAGPTSTAGNTSVDEWAQNVLGRAATPAEIAQYGSYTDPASAAKAYAAFVAAAQQNGEAVNPLTLAQASQLGAQQQNKPQVTTYKPTLLGAPTPWNVTADQTVEGRINNLVDPNSPIIQQAMARAAQASNSRGLLNSSIAATAGQSAAFDAAIPIATADAATAAKAAGYNADEQNQFDVQNAGYGNSAGQFNASANNQAASQNSAQGSQMAIAQFNAGAQKALQTLSGEQQTAQAKIAADNQTLLNTNQQAAQAFNQHSVNLANINSSASMDATAKRIAIANENASFQSQLNVLGSVAGLNLSSLLSFAGMDGFDAQGKYVGVDANGNTNGATPAAPAPAAAPAPVVETTSA